MTKEECKECLNWLQKNMSLLDDWKDYNYDYKMIKLLWTHMRQELIRKKDSENVDKFCNL